MHKLAARGVVYVCCGLAFGTPKTLAKHCREAHSFRPDPNSITRQELAAREIAFLRTLTEDEKAEIRAKMRQNLAARKAR